MKRIIKATEPSQFANWKAGDKMASRGRPRWNRVPGQIRQAVHDSLIREQGALCCYCEARVARSNSHVEHFRPVEDYQLDQLDYTNLLCSCVRDQIQGETDHCGHRKGSWFDEELLITPLAPGCEDRFRFTGDGQVFAAGDDEAAKTTIDRLGLNLPKLQALRAEAVDALADLPVADVQTLLATPTPAGEFVEFFTTIRQLLT